MIPTGRRYTTTLTGWVWRPVRCEACDCEFAYRMQVVATGTGHSPLYLNNAGAQQNSQANARKDFDKKAQNQIAAVNCPQCNQLQNNMIRLLKKQRWYTVAGLLLALAVAAFFVYWPGHYFDQYVLILAGIALLIDGIYLFNHNARLQSIYPFVVMVAIVIWLVTTTLSRFVFLSMPIGVIVVLFDSFLAFNYDPQKNAWRPGARRRYDILVMRRAEMEDAARQILAQKGQVIPLPRWP